MRAYVRACVYARAHVCAAAVVADDDDVFIF